MGIGSLKKGQEMKPIDIKRDPNSLLIPRDIGARKIQTTYHSDAPKTESAIKGSSLSDPCKTIEEPKTKPLPKGSAAEADVDKKRIAEEAQKKEAENKEMIEMRARAQDFQNQIRWWESQRGQGEHDDNKIDGMISMIKGQLGGIDGKYWT